MPALVFRLLFVQPASEYPPHLNDDLRRSIVFRFRPCRYHAAFQICEVVDEIRVCFVHCPRTRNVQVINNRDLMRVFILQNLSHPQCVGIERYFEGGSEFFSCAFGSEPSSVK